MTPSPPPPRRAVLLMGPTGAGKSDLAVRLAQQWPFEIVSTDSALVYRGMDIGTAKPDAAARAAVPHHLIDIRDPAQRYSAGEFVADAAGAVEGIWRRGGCPLFVGGTMLYFQALTAGLAPLPAGRASVRAELDARALGAGWPSLHAELARVDAPAAARIHPNDAQRIQRALEVYLLTGEPISRLQQARVSILESVEVLELAVSPGDRQALQRRLGARFTAMLAAGFEGEVRRLHERSDLTAEHPSMRAVGYRQMWRYVSGQCSFDQACSEAVAATRQLAKRQLTWLRARARAVWVDPDRPAAVEAISAALAVVGIHP